MTVQISIKWDRSFLMLFSFSVHRLLISFTIEIKNGKIDKCKLLLSAEFSKFFWPEMVTCWSNSLNYSYIHGELSTSQREAIITLMEKKDRDPRLIKNWRPISLINVVVEIGLKADRKEITKSPAICIPS